MNRGTQVGVIISGILTLFFILGIVEDVLGNQKIYSVVTDVLVLVASWGATGFYYFYSTRKQLQRKEAI